MPSDPSSSSDDASTGVSSPDPAISRRRLLAAASATTVGGGLLSGRVGAAPSDAPTGSATPQGQSEQDVVRERAWVETDVDTNDDGEPDRVYVEIARHESMGDGERLPVILQASPYYGEQTHSDTTEEMLFDRETELGADGETQAGSATAAATRATSATGSHVAGSASASPAESTDSQQRAEEWIGPSWVENRYVEEYVIAYAASVGIGESTGCYTAAGPATVEGLKAVVEWFDGRATAYDARTGGDPVEATWTDGTTGMIGASGVGELANGVATTGVDGLEAVVPQAANASQYSLFRANGTPISIVPERGDRIADLSSWIEAGTAERPDCGHWGEAATAGQARETGDYNDFWHEREFLPDADAVEAGVLLTHAVDDRTVKPNQVADWYEELSAADVPVRLWLHEGGHTIPRGDEWFDVLDRWWAHWLKGEDNGVLEEDPVTVVHGSSSASRGSTETYADWPVPDAEATTIGLTPDGGAGRDGATGSLTLETPDDAEATFVDDPTRRMDQLAAADDDDHRLRFETPPLGEDVHVSGRVVPDLTVSMDEPTVLSVAVVEFRDHGPDAVTRGWADPQNRPAFSESDSPVAYKQSLRDSSPIDPGERVSVEFPLQATDHVFEAGSRIGVIVYASDQQFTLHPSNEAEVTVALGESSVSLPVVGGDDALAAAFEGEPNDDGGGAEDDSGTDDGSSGADDGDDGGDGSEDDGLPGFGVGSALAALGGVGYALRRRVGSDRRTE